MKNISFLSTCAIFIFGSSALVPMNFAAAQEPEEAPQAMLVLDASGSMWGQVDGRHKIEIARDVIGETVSDWDQSTELGLMAYGHNRQGDCSDIELLVPPGPLDAEAFAAQANSLNPKGKTPLSDAVRQAASVLDYEGRRATVILISDGKETCNLDPCAVGQSLEETGIDFTAHVIGFDVSKEDSIGLRCLAEETGGAYIDAKDSEQLEVALQQTRDVVTDTTEIEIVSASIDVPVEVFAGSSFEAKWDGPKNAADYLVIRSEGGADDFGVIYIGADSVQSPSIMTAPADSGTYTVHYALKDGTSLAEDTLLVILPEASVDAPESVMAGAEFSVSWTGPANEFDFLRMFDLEGNPMHEFQNVAGIDGNPVTLTAPVELGDYEIMYRTQGRKTLATDTFTVTEALATVKAPKEAYAGADIEVQWTGPQNQYDRLRMIDSAGERMNNFEFVHRENTPDTLTMTAPLDEGEYFIAYDASSEKILAQQSLTVLPVTAMIDGPSSVAAGEEYEITWYGPNYKGDSIYTFNAAGKDAREYVIFRENNSLDPITLEAPKTPGTYELRYRLKGKKVLATHSFTVQ